MLIHPCYKPMTTCLSFFLAASSLFGGGEEKPAKVLEVTKTTPKIEVRQRQIGYGDTLLFYTFKDQSAVLRLQIDNKDKSFPMTGIIYIFAEDATNDGIKKWINNQHSDGIYPDPAQPVASLKIPANICKVASSKLIDQAQMGLGVYDNYAITFEVKDYEDSKGIKLKGFSGETRAHIKVK